MSGNYNWWIVANNGKEGMRIILNYKISALDSIIGTPNKWAVCVPVPPTGLSLFFPLKLRLDTLPFDFLWNISSFGLTCQTALKISYEIYLGNSLL